MEELCVTYIDIDGDNGVTIDDCIELSRTVESQLDRDVEDFALDVSSAGADQPLKLTRQFIKNIGRDLEAVTFDGEKVEGELVAADEASITLHIPAAKKRPAEDITLQRKDVKTARVVIKF